jgi:hypothetical protein
MQELHQNLDGHGKRIPIGTLVCGLSVLLSSVVSLSSPLSLLLVLLKKRRGRRTDYMVMMSRNEEKSNEEQK